jgi:hypothetical protein
MSEPTPTDTPINDERMEQLARQTRELIGDTLKMEGVPLSSKGCDLIEALIFEPIRQVRDAERAGRDQAESKLTDERTTSDYLAAAIQMTYPHATAIARYNKGLDKSQSTPAAGIVFCKLEQCETRLTEAIGYLSQSLDCFLVAKSVPTFNSNEPIGGQISVGTFNKFREFLSSTQPPTILAELQKLRGELESMTRRHKAAQDQRDAVIQSVEAMNKSAPLTQDQRGALAGYVADYLQRGVHGVWHDLAAGIAALLKHTEAAESELAALKLKWEAAQIIIEQATSRVSEENTLLRERDALKLKVEAAKETLRQIAPHKFYGHASKLATEAIAQLNDDK